MKNRVLCCGFDLQTFQPRITEYITAETARQRNIMAVAQPDSCLHTFWLPINGVAQVFAAFPELRLLQHVSKGPGYLSGVTCAHRTLPRSWHHAPDAADSKG